MGKRAISPDLAVPRNSAAGTGFEAVDVSSVDYDPQTGAAQRPHTRGIWVGVAGNIAVDGAEFGTNVVIPNVPVGLWALAVSKIYHSGTTASSLVAVF